MRKPEFCSKILVVCLPFILLAAGPALSKSRNFQENTESRLQWFRDAKLGIFIHWGIYSVYGIDESWSFYNGYISYEDYMKQLKGFSAEAYDPEKWAELFHQSGARYAVLTAKHHDGVALWPTKHSDLNIVEQTPAGRDLIAPFCRALRKKGLKVGLYFSHLDWSHPDYPFFTKTKKRYEEDLDRWQRFLYFRQGQIEELAKNYKPDLFWFDGDWDFNAEKWDSKNIRDYIREILPGTIINSRINGYGDYATPEQGLPITRPKEQDWELCMTMNDSWGYQKTDKNYKTPNQIIRIFIDCISMGGNLLLDVGPKEDGTIPEEQVTILKALGIWIRKHAEAVYGTQEGLPPEYFYGPSTLSADRQTIFLFLAHAPRGPVVVKGLTNKIHRIRVVGLGTKLSWKVMGKPYWSNIPGLVYIDVPEDVLDKEVTVLALLLDGPLRIYNKDEESSLP